MSPPLELPGVQTPPQSLNLPGPVWGIDCSTHVIALAIIRPPGPGEVPEVGCFHMGVRDLDKGARRLAGLREDLADWLQRFERFGAPVAVLVEQPFGQGKARPHPQSYYIVATVLLTLAQHYPHAAIDVIDPTSWKAAAMGEGYGFAKKRAILGWALQHGATRNCSVCHGDGAGDCKPLPAHDEADALGIATAAGIRWEASGRLR